MNRTQKLLSDTVVYTKYAKYNEELKRRETWDEICDRYEGMLIKKYPSESENIVNHMQLVRDRKILMSMRMAQFSGAAVEKNESRGYNCSFLPIDDYRAFSEIMFLLLGGTGVGYSVQKHHVDKLPEIQKPIKESKFLIGDSIEGWADAVKQLMKAYFGITKVKPRFDYSDIRPKGSRLITAGGKAPGPDPLRICLVQIEALLNNKKNGEKLTTLEAHDIACHIADAVLAGGIRRAALISLFSFGDIDMQTCKGGNWWELNPQRGRANNSVVLLRSRIKEHEFKQLWEYISSSGWGEPGIYFTNDPEYGTNPCCEISLRPFTFCNLCEVNAATVESVEDFEARVESAAYFGTLQAGFTDFHYLRPIWRKNTEKDALIGVGITGIASNKLNNYDKKRIAGIAKRVNKEVSERISINSAARVTTIKPSGTTSCVLGTSSGIHAWHSKYFIRNIQTKVGDELYNFFNAHHPKLIKVMDLDPNSAVIGVPMEANDEAIFREDETAMELLERIKDYNVNWVQAGHRRGPNTNNVSATVSLKPEDWEPVGEWMWENKHTFNGLSVLPYDGGQYKDAPFMETTEERFNELVEYIKENPIDLTKIEEFEDKTELSQELACAGGACETSF